MKRKMFVFPLVVLLLVVLSASTVMADKPLGVPHNGGCVSFCARAIFYEDFDGDGEWEPWDINGDGKIQNCLLESAYLVDPPETCLHANVPGVLECPEVDGWTCLKPGDWGGAVPVWCRLMHGEDTHGRGQHTR